VDPPQKDYKPIKDSLKKAEKLGLNKMWIYAKMGISIRYCNIVLHSWRTFTGIFMMRMVENEDSRG